MAHKLTFHCRAFRPTFSIIFSRQLSILPLNKYSQGLISPRVIDSLAKPRRFLSVNDKLQGIKVEKDLLVKLRKQTGFSFAKCKEALALNGNSYSAAESWLLEQADKEGWAKATKLQGRTASEGLIGVTIDNNVAAMVEVNCETDFVGRNDAFVDLVSMVTNSALNQRKAIIEQNQRINTLGSTPVHLREVLLTHDMRDLATPQGKLDDLVARMIGKVGENIKLKRAITMTTESSNMIGYHVHGSFTKHTGKLSLGKFGAIVAIQPLCNMDQEKLSVLSNNIAKHIVGMDPKVITHDDVSTNESQETDINDILVEQDYLLDSSKTVGAFLEEEGVEVVDFVRYECGEK